MRRTPGDQDPTKPNISRRALLGGLLGAAVLGVVGCAPSETSADQPTQTPGATEKQTPGTSQPPSGEATPDTPKVYDFDPANSDFYKGLSDKDKDTLKDILTSGSLDEFYKEDYDDRLRTTDLIAGFVGEALNEFHGTDQYGIDSFSASPDEVRNDPSIAMFKAQAKLDVGFQLLRTYKFTNDQLVKDGVDVNDVSDPRVTQLLMRQVLARFILIGSRKYPTQTQEGGWSQDDSSRDWQLTKAIEEKIESMVNGNDLETTASDFIGVSQSNAEYDVREDTAAINGVATEMSIDLTNPHADELNNTTYTISTIEPLKVDGKKYSTWNILRAYK